MAPAASNALSIPIWMQPRLRLPAKTKVVFAALMRVDPIARWQASWSGRLRGLVFAAAARHRRRGVARHLVARANQKLRN